MTLSPIAAMVTIATTVVGIALLGTQAMAQTNSKMDLVQFPTDYARGVHYTTVHRGNIREELFANREAIEAAKKGQSFPSGTVITMEDHRDGKLYRYIVMEKRTGWGKLSPENLRAGDWLFREFRPDKTLNAAEDGGRCMACHRSEAGNDFVFTVEKMKSAN